MQHANRHIYLCPHLPYTSRLDYISIHTEVFTLVLCVCLVYVIDLVLER